LYFQNLADFENEKEKGPHWIRNGLRGERCAIQWNSVSALLNLWHFASSKKV